MNLMPDVKQNYLDVLRTARSIAEDCGRDPEDIRLIAVSKTKPLELVEEAALAGAVDFGENRPQELAVKQEQRPELRWHQIGHLQKNKVKLVVGKAEFIHSVDSLELASLINKRAASLGVLQKILLQVNITGEETKFGVSPGELEGLIEGVRPLGNIRLEGLMTISAPGYTPQQNAEVFKTLKALAVRQGLHELSMGMTHDFKEAIECGATMIRVGTAIFGERDYQNKR